MECLKNLVGLSRSSCTCFNDNRPPDYNTSQSGKYITDADGIPLVFTNSAADCEKGGVWKILENARAQALTDFTKDALNALNTFKRERFIPFPPPVGGAGVKQMVGGRAFNSSSSFFPAATIAGHVIRPKKIQGGRAVLNGGSLALMNAAGQPVTITVVSSINLTELATTTITAGGDGVFVPFEFNSPVVLPFDDEDGPDQVLQYFVFYSIPSGASFINNEIITSCCGGYKSLDKNAFLYYVRNNSELYGFEAADIATAKDQPLARGNAAKGLRLDVSFGCDGLQWVCGLTANPNAVNDTYNGSGLSWGLHIAELIKYRAVELVASTLLNTPNINSFTLLNHEHIVAIAERAANIYTSGINFLGQKLPTWANDCYTCKSDKFSISSILR